MLSARCRPSSAMSFRSLSSTFTSILLQRPLHFSLSRPSSCRSFHSISPSLAPSSPSSSSGSNKSTATASSREPQTSMFGSRLRVSPDSHTGPIAPAKSENDIAASFTRANRGKGNLLAPQRISRGNSAQQAKMHRELHQPNKKDLNHSLAYYIEKQKDWRELVQMAFDHMHHMSHHNLVRIMKRLVKVSDTRQNLDGDCYNKFGRFMVVVENQLHKLSSLGLMQQAFVPYHYLRQVVKQQWQDQQEAVKAVNADPKEAARRRRSVRLETEFANQAAHETRSIEQRMKHLTQMHKAKYDFGRNEDKSKKIRAEERRAGRAFVSVSQTLRERGGKGTASKSRPTAGKRS